MNSRSQNISIDQLLDTATIPGLINLIQISSEQDIENIFIKLNDHDNKQLILSQLIEQLKARWDLQLAKAIHKYVIENGGELNEISKDELQSIILYADKLQLIEDPEYKQFCIKLMSQFIFGMGNINYYGGLLTLAAIHSAKPHIMPTLFNFTNETLRYFQTLNKAPRPLRERFVCFTNHWICGDIKINEQGQTSIVIIDSLGDYKLITDPNYTGSTSCVSVLPHFFKIFPHSEIFLVNEKRQWTQKGCSVFAIDDVIHLYSVENFLGNKYEDLFDFLRKNPIKMIQRKGMTIHISSLPLHLMRTMASNSLLGILKQSEDKEIPLNKKGETAQSLLDQPIRTNFFQNKLHKEQTKLHNNRLEYKLANVANKNLNFLLENDKDTLKLAMDQHGLPGFINRVEEKIKSASNDVINESKLIKNNS